MGKILFISCGKRNGNTFQAANVAATAARDAGAETRLVEAIRLNGIGRGCHSCMKCQHTSDFGCIFQDEVADLLLQMADYDMLVFCMPVFFFSMGMQTKGIIDRLFSMVKFNGETLSSPLKGKKFALLVTSGAGESDSGEQVVRMSYTAMVKYFSGEFVGELYFANCDAQKGGLANDIEMPDRARRFGMMLAEEAK